VLHFDVNLLGGLLYLLTALYMIFTLLTAFVKRPHLLTEPVN
jgi:hypothetical protein